MYTRRDLFFGPPSPNAQDETLLSSERGAAAIEYGLIASLIAIVMLVIVALIGWFLFR